MSWLVCIVWWLGLGWLPVFWKSSPEDTWRKWCDKSPRHLISALNHALSLIVLEEKNKEREVLNKHKKHLYSLFATFIGQSMPCGAIFNHFHISSILFSTIFTTFFETCYHSILNNEQSSDIESTLFVQHSKTCETQKNSKVKDFTRTKK